MKMLDLYMTVTNTIISDLEKGVASWVKPWKNGNAGAVMPTNAATSREYSGINIPILWHAQSSRGFPTARWMTYKQAQSRDAHVRKGEHGTTVVFTKRLTVKDRETDEEKRLNLLRTYTVFNVSQIEGLPSDPLVHETPHGSDVAMHFIDATKADVRIGSDCACYIPSKELHHTASRAGIYQPRALPRHGIA